MSTAYQFTNENLLVNVGYQGEILDICWPIKGANNLFLRNDIHDEIWINEKKSETHYLTIPNYDSNELRAIYTDSIDSLEIKMVVELINNGIIRNYEFKNKSNEVKKIWLFIITTPDFLSNHSRDTVIYYPPIKGIVHYEGNTFLSINSAIDPDQYGCQDPGDFNNRGASPDVAGDLSLNPVTNGKTQSCLKYEISIKPLETKKITINICLHSALPKINHINTKTTNSISSESDNLLTKTKILSELLDLNVEEKQKLDLLALASNYIVTGSFNNNGSIFAAVDSSFFKTGGVDDYAYFWPRDAALIAMAHVKTSSHAANNGILSNKYKRLLNFTKKCFGIDNYLLHRYRLEDGTLGSSWHNWIDEHGKYTIPLQLDQTALTIYSYYQYKKYLPEIADEKYEQLLEQAAEFLLQQIDENGLHKPCYDLWENHYGIFLSEQVSIIAAFNCIVDNTKNDEMKLKLQEKLSQMRKAIEPGGYFVHKQGYFTRGQIANHKQTELYNNTIDSSFHWLWQLGVLPVTNDLLKNTANKAEQILKINNGFARYENDYYLKKESLTTGNPWYISTLWFARYYLKTGQIQKAKETLQFVLRHMETTGLLPEMAHPTNGMALSVKPLIWSHAEALNLLNYEVS